MIFRHAPRRRHGPPRLMGLGAPDPIEGTSLPSSELLMASTYGTDTAPDVSNLDVLTPAADPTIRTSVPTRAPVSPSELGPTFGPPAPSQGRGESLFGITLPMWLPKWAAITGLIVLGAFGADYLMRHGGRRVVSNPKGRRRRGRFARVVEGDDDDLLERARQFRKDFHWGIEGKKVVKRKVSKRPKVLTKLGEMTEVTYKTKKRGEKAVFFTHDFESKKPTLAMDIENKRLHIVGGDYTVTADGITG